MLVERHRQPNKQVTLGQWRVDVGPASKTVVQRQLAIGPKSLVSRECTSIHPALCAVAGDKRSRTGNVAYQTRAAECVFF